MPHRGVVERSGAASPDSWSYFVSVVAEYKIIAICRQSAHIGSVSSRPAPLQRAWNLEFSRQARATLIDLILTSATLKPSIFSPIWRTRRDTRRQLEVLHAVQQQHHGFLSEQRDPHSQSGLPYSQHPHRRHSQAFECFHPRVFRARQGSQQPRRYVSSPEHHLHRASPACISRSPESKRKRREPSEHERGYEDCEITRGTGGVAG